jgi:UDP-N-acetylmuramate dehydrogenase
MSAQPLIEKTLGCVFKNSGETEFSSGELIDKAGLKGYTSGGAVISDKHANFIVNAGGATVRDIKELMNVVFLKLKERFGVCLEPEIEIL